MTLETKLNNAVNLISEGMNLLTEIQEELFYQQLADSAVNDERQTIHDENYARLTLFCKTRKETLSNDLFKAVLWAMDGVAIYKKERGEAIRFASVMHKVPEDVINYWLNEMKFRKKRTTKQEVTV